MGFTVTFSTGGGGGGGGGGGVGGSGGGGGGGGGGAAAKISDSVRSKLITCSFLFSGGFPSAAGTAKFISRGCFLSGISAEPFLASFFDCTEACLIFGSSTL
uniref:Uncharacterized protein n=1 Tax=Arundo donax TaxID=35708 RepID=A0A0A9G514_ARUDO